MLYRDSLTLSRVLTKDNQIAFHFLDWYWYCCGAFASLPYAFNRNKIYTIESKTIQFVFYEYHTGIVYLLAMIGFALTIMKCNRGYVKYQLRRQVFAFMTLLYVFVLSMAQIFNLYMGYIFFLCPILSVRFNLFLRDRLLRRFSAEHWNFLFVCNLVATAIFCFVLSGILCDYQHLVCRQDELTLKLYVTKHCEVHPTFER